MAGSFPSSPSSACPGGRKLVRVLGSRGVGSALSADWTRPPPRWRRFYDHFDGADSRADDQPLDRLPAGRGRVFRMRRGTTTTTPPEAVQRDVAGRFAPPSSAATTPAPVPCSSAQTRRLSYSSCNGPRHRGEPSMRRSGSRLGAQAAVGRSATRVRARRETGGSKRREETSSCSSRRRPPEQASGSSGSSTSVRCSAHTTTRSCCRPNGRRLKGV